MGAGGSRPGMAAHAGSAGRPLGLNLAASRAALAQAGWARGASLSQAERGIAPGSARMQRWGPSAQRGPAVVEGGRDAAGASHSPSKSSAKERRWFPQPPMPTSGQLSLLGVAFLWGTYAPALRFLYGLPGPPCPAALTAVRTLIQSSVLLASAVAQGASSAEPRPQGSSKAGPQRSKDGAGGAAGMLQQALNFVAPTLVVGGLELGLWNFAASSTQALGLEFTTATRAAFLIQATALLTPLLASLSGDRPGRAVWSGCAVALLGTVLLTLDHAAPAAVSASAKPIAIGGDACIFVSAFFFSLATVRLGKLASSFPTLRLAAAKSLVMALIAAGWLGTSALGQVASGQPISALWAGYADPLAWGAILWASLGPGALAAFLQTQGQSSVPAAQSQVIFSSLPLWSALFAVLLLNETLGPLGWAGGLSIVGAGLIASRGKAAKGAET